MSRSGRSDDLGAAALSLDPDADCLGDPALQLGWNLVAAFRCDDLTQLDLEIEAVRTRRALVEMPGDRAPPPHRQLAVEVLVDANDRFVAVHLFPLSPPWVRCRVAASLPPKFPPPVLEL